MSFFMRPFKAPAPMRPCAAGEAPTTSGRRCRKPTWAKVRRKTYTSAFLSGSWPAPAAEELVAPDEAPVPELAEDSEPSLSKLLADYTARRRPKLCARPTNYVVHSRLDSAKARHVQGLLESLEAGNTIGATLVCGTPAGEEPVAMDVEDNVLTPIAAAPDPLIGSEVQKKFLGFGTEKWTGEVTSGPDAFDRFKVYWPRDKSVTFHTRSVLEPLVTRRGPPGEAEASAALVGRRVRVFWPDEGDWFGGRLSSYDKRSGHHCIAYDDGDKDTLDIIEPAEDKRVEVLGPEARTRSPSLDLEDAEILTTSDAEMLTPSDAEMLTTSDAEMLTTSDEDEPNPQPPLALELSSDEEVPTKGAAAEAQAPKKASGCDWLLGHAAASKADAAKRDGSTGFTHSTGGDDDADGNPAKRHCASAQHGRLRDDFAQTGHVKIIDSAHKHADETGIVTETGGKGWISVRLDGTGETVKVRKSSLRYVDDKLEVARNPLPKAIFYRKAAEVGNTSGNRELLKKVRDAFVDRFRYFDEDVTDFQELAPIVKDNLGKGKAKQLESFELLGERWRLSKHNDKYKLKRSPLLKEELSESQLINVNVYHRDCFRVIGDRLEDAYGQRRDPKWPTIAGKGHIAKGSPFAQKLLMMAKTDEAHALDLFLHALDVDPTLRTQSRSRFWRDRPEPVIAKLLFLDDQGLEKIATLDTEGRKISRKAGDLDKIYEVGVEAVDTATGVLENVMRLTNRSMRKEVVDGSSRRLRPALIETMPEKLKCQMGDVADMCLAGQGTTLLGSYGSYDTWYMKEYLPDCDKIKPANFLAAVRFVMGTNAAGAFPAGHPLVESGAAGSVSLGLPYIRDVLYSGRKFEAHEAWSDCQATCIFLKDLKAALKRRRDGTHNIDGYEVPEAYEGKPGYRKRQRESTL
eukprot:CAMPEP_0119261268 /NCGR_PEP_ID=MMETSP1329-20130426/1387_1 /TAXON_ID=114041 /ORGANISM="Genus nov. species nov., Strain RCC1024" /LENGTH=912 /DNA_ID=CAMNT_0007260807 /DNA_START=517 /DNA_END=3255 /DNA_ORIENTATION=+